MHYLRYGTGPFQRLINKWFRQTMLIRFQKTIVACNPLEGKTILDVGCGPGIYSITLAKGSPNFVYGIDFAPSMVEMADKRQRKQGGKYLPVLKLPILIPCGG